MAIPGQRTAWCYLSEQSALGGAVSLLTLGMEEPLANIPRAPLLLDDKLVEVRDLGLTLVFQ